MFKLDPTLIKFIVVGLSNTLVSYITFLVCLKLFSELTIKATVSQLIGYGVGIVWSFIWNRSWTFKSGGKISRQLQRFIILQLTFAFSSALLIGLLVDYFYLNSHLSWLFVMAIVTILNYWISKKWVFTNE